jgi:hypothetical protein
VKRSDDLVESGNIEEFQETASEYGYDLLRIAKYNITALGDGVREKLINTGRTLHLVETMNVYMDGGASLRAIQDRVKEAAEGLDRIIEMLESNTSV